MKYVFLSLLFVVLAIPGVAQKSILAGTVYDETGAVIPNVRVTATGPDGSTFRHVTNESGEYSLELPFASNAGEKYGKRVYRIQFESPDPGFQKKVFQDFLFVSSTKGKMFLDCVLEMVAVDPQINRP